MSLTRPPVSALFSFKNNFSSEVDPRSRLLSAIAQKIASQHGDHVAFNMESMSVQLGF